VGKGRRVKNVPDRNDGQPRAEQDLKSTVDTDVDLDELRDGGLTRTPGVRTTTGGTAGPASLAGLRPRNDGAGPTTTGDAGSGGMGTPIGGATSDATTAGQSGGTVTGGSDTDPDSR
jgi:hypothetical protein